MSPVHAAVKVKLRQEGAQVDECKRVSSSGRVQLPV